MKHSTVHFPIYRPIFGWSDLLLLSVLCLGCGETAALTADMPLHLEDQLEFAVIEGSDVPDDVPQAVTWDFAEPQPEWKVVERWKPEQAGTELSRTEDALRIAAGDVDVTDDENDSAWGAIYIDVPGWERDDWAHIQVRARSEADVDWMVLGVGFNVRDKSDAKEEEGPIEFRGENAQLIRDGTVQTYTFRADWDRSAGEWEGPWRQLVVGFGASNEASIDILSVTVVPKGAVYAEAPHGVRPVTIGKRIRRTLYTHAPGRFSYRVRVPQSGRLDASMGVLGDDAPVTFRVQVQPDRGPVETLFEERYADPERWAQRSVGLSKFSGQTVTLVLETQAEQPGTVAFWGAPTVSGARRSAKPNVIFYVIDGGAADQMSLYGYNRRTTPNLERLAAEGALFERAYSNSTWTRPSTTSFMTSLHNSVLGGTAPCCDMASLLPEEARTMAERFHEAGYLTAVFTSNPNAGSVVNLERGVDVFRDAGCCNRAPNKGKSGSTLELHRDFWTWRDAYPGEPYWVHFQTTDVHKPHRPLAPFAGLFAPGGEAQLARWDSTVTQWWQENSARDATEPNLWRQRWAEAGLDRIQYHNLWRALFDETMAHQDYQLGRFVERLKETGQWENTLLIIAGDHSINNGSIDFVVQLEDSLIPGWSIFGDPIFRSTVSRVPLLFIWPGRIAAGQRFRQPVVSMIDVLPTILDLVGLPMPEVMQGQSLAPLLLGEKGWEPRPVIFDDFNVDQATGELRGHIEMIDGRWGASLEINPEPPEEEDAWWRRPVPLLLYDVWNDPLALTLVNDAHPELVTKYTDLLQEQWEAHRLLAQRFTPGGTVELTPEQLETLRSLGYIQ